MATVTTHASAAGMFRPRSGLITGEVAIKPVLAAASGSGSGSALKVVARNGERLADRSLFSGLPHRKLEGGGNGVYKRRGSVRANAVPTGDHFHLMAVLVQHAEGQRDFITVKSIWHLSDQAIKNVYMFYIMFFCWGCLFFGSTKDPYYDSDAYRKDGGDGTGHWVYEKQEDIEEAARAALWREELIEEIEQRVEGLPELEEATTKK